jgi:hypothetical protein
VESINRKSEQDGDVGQQPRGVCENGFLQCGRHLWFLEKGRRRNDRGGVPVKWKPGRTLSPFRKKTLPETASILGSKDQTTGELLTVA